MIHQAGLQSLFLTMYIARRPQNPYRGFKHSYKQKALSQLKGNKTVTKYIRLFFHRSSNECTDKVMTWLCSVYLFIDRTVS